MSQFVLITRLFTYKNKLNTDSLTSKNYYLGEATDHEQNDIKIKVVCVATQIINGSKGTIDAKAVFPFNLAFDHELTTVCTLG